MDSKIQYYLGQLGKEELLRLAKKRNARGVDKNTPETELKKILAPYVTQKEIDELHSTGKIGADAVIKGKKFEKKCVDYLTKLDYDCKSNYTAIEGMEFDIIGIRRQIGLSWTLEVKRLLVVECKDQKKVSMLDFEKFYAKFIHLLKRFKTQTKVNTDDAKCFIMTSGMFDPTLVKTASYHPEVELYREDEEHVFIKIIE